MPRARLLWTLIAIGALCAVLALASRVRLEREARSLDILIDAYGLLDFCQAEGLDPADTLARLKSAGVTAVALPETTVERLTATGLASVQSGADFSRQLRARAPGLPQTARRPDPARTYVVVSDASVLSDLETFLPFVLGPDRAHRWPEAADRTSPSEGHPVVLELTTSEHSLASGGLGFSRSDLRAIQKQGLRVYLRPQNRSRFGDSDIAAFVKTLVDTASPAGLIFEGVSNEVLGYPDSLEATETAMREHRLLFGNIEVPTVDAAQKGSQTLGRKLSSQTVRVFSLAPLQQAKMTPDDAIDRYRLGARERNMRVLYVRPFAAPVTGSTLLQTNLDYIKALHDDLARSGFVFSGARPFPALAPGGLWLVGMALGTAAAGVLFLELFVAVPAPLVWSLLCGLPLLAAACAAMHRGSLASTLLALAAAQAFSVLGLAFGLPMLRAESESAPSGGRALLGATLPLVLVTAVSLLGGVYMAGFMSETSFMLSVHMFRGIKLIMVVSPALVVLLWMTRFAPRRETLRDLLDHRMAFWHLLAFGALAAAGAFYVARTGNASPAAASDYERVVRNFLETTLVVRPRFKEFAFGHPAWFVLAGLLWKRGGQAWTWLLVLCAAISQVDVVDTFAHAHTPYLISLTRALIGLALGIALGLPLAAVVTRITPEGFEPAHDAEMGNVPGE